MNEKKVVSSTTQERADAFAPILLFQTRVVFRLNFCFLGPHEKTYPRWLKNDSFFSL